MRNKNSKIIKAMNSYSVYLVDKNTDNRFRSGSATVPVDEPQYAQRMLSRLVAQYDMNLLLDWKAVNTYLYACDTFVVAENDSHLLIVESY